MSVEVAAAPELTLCPYTSRIVSTTGTAEVEPLLSSPMFSAPVTVSFTGLLDSAAPYAAGLVSRLDSILVHGLKEAPTGWHASVPSQMHAVGGWVVQCTAPPARLALLFSRSASTSTKPGQGALPSDRSSAFSHFSATAPPIAARLPVILQRSHVMLGDVPTSVRRPPPYTAMAPPLPALAVLPVISADVKSTLDMASMRMAPASWRAALSMNLVPRSSAEPPMRASAPPSMALLPMKAVAGKLAVLMPSTLTPPPRTLAEQLWMVQPSRVRSTSETWMAPLSPPTHSLTVVVVSFRNMPASMRESRARIAAPRRDVHPSKVAPVTVTLDSVMLMPPPSRLALLRSSWVFVMMRSAAASEIPPPSRNALLSLMTPPAITTRPRVRKIPAPDLDAEHRLMVGLVKNMPRPATAPVELAWSFSSM
mmetsp:Transcript_40588/g.100297  ORF Transcript_40588/g.100297 Transcript_40588/m.100297 type:complete len:423 (+) Transcript_40588:265-1533(+)